MYIDNCFSVQILSGFIIKVNKNHQKCKIKAPQKQGRVNALFITLSIKYNGLRLDFLRQTAVKPVEMNR